MPVNSIVIAACLEWMERHTPLPPMGRADTAVLSPHITPAPRWATIRRAAEMGMGRPGQAQYPFERFTQSAQKLLTLAQAEAKAAGHSYIGTEHVLLASFADERFESAQILDSLGVTVAAVRSAQEKLLTGGAPSSGPQIRPTARVKIVIETAFRICGAAGHPLVGTGHMLLALTVEGKGIAARALEELGATRERIEQVAGSAEPEP